MATRASYRAKCAFCGYEGTKAAMTKHLAQCPARASQMQAADAARNPETLYHIRAQAAGQKAFWLELEVRGASTLDQIDSYLRTIWLECCGHMSQFYLGRRYGTELSMRRKIYDAVRAGTEWFHLYDFGTTSETELQVMGQRKGAPLTTNPIVLMARNLMPQEPCVQCGEPATHLCMECVNEENIWGVLCAKHARSHPHDDYGEPVPLVNSPRLGMCGYDGPAVPPY